MDHLTGRAALAATFLSVALTACGGGGGSATAEAPAPSAETPAPAPAAVSGVSTPSSVSVVTAKNAE